LALYPSRVRSNEVLDGIRSPEAKNHCTRNHHKNSNAKVLGRPLARRRELADCYKGERSIDRSGHCEQAQWQRE
jgi:hypothetical protein